MRVANSNPFLSDSPAPRKQVMNAEIDVSRTAQIRDIESSFAACNENLDLTTLRHPTKPNVTAVDSYEVFPDADIWSNAYDLFRFSERPGERPIDVCAVPLSNSNVCLPSLRFSSKRTLDWTVPFSGQWSRTETISWRTTSRKKTKTLSRSSRRASTHQKAPPVSQT